MPLLALDTSTHRLFAGLSLPPLAPSALERVFVHEGDGGAHTSASLVPTLLTLLAQGGVTLTDLDALVFGRGPGSFTGLRTACAVVQGLAWGSRPARHPQGLPVLGIDTLLAVAEDARFQTQAQHPPGPLTVTAVLDARMGELYAATYRFACAHQPQAECLGGPWLLKPHDLAGLTAPFGPGQVLASHALEVCAPHWSDATSHQQTAWPTADALLRLAPGLLAQGQATPAQDAQPLYVRDKVAQTTDERALARAQAA